MHQMADAVCARWLSTGVAAGFGDVMRRLTIKCTPYFAAVLTPGPANSVTATGPAPRSRTDVPMNVSSVLWSGPAFSLL